MESENEAESEGASPSAAASWSSSTTAPGSSDDGFDLHLQWVNGPPEHRIGTAVSRAPERPTLETRPVVEAFSSGRRQSERMRLVLALGQSEVELRGAIDAIDARAAGLQDDSMEEVREYLAAAFDAIRELTGQLVTLTDRLELAPGRPPAEQIVELAAPPPQPPPPASAAPLDAHAVDRLERSLIRIASGQEDILRELERVADEVEAYRRRVQVHARPPVITDAQVEEIVARLGGQPKPARPMPPAARQRVAPDPVVDDEPAPVVVAEPEPPAAEEPAPEKRTSRRARRAAGSVAEPAPAPGPVTEEVPDVPEASTAEPEPAPEEPEPAPPAKRMSRRERRAQAKVAEAPPPSPPTEEHPPPAVDEEPDPVIAAEAPAPAPEKRPTRRGRRAPAKAATVPAERDEPDEPELSSPATTTSREAEEDDEADAPTPAEELAAALDALRPGFAEEARREQEAEDLQKRGSWRERRRRAQAGKAGAQEPSAGDAEGGASDDDAERGPSAGETDGDA